MACQHREAEKGGVPGAKLPLRSRRGPSTQDSDSHRQCMLFEKTLIRSVFHNADSRWNALTPFLPCDYGLDSGSNHFLRHKVFFECTSTGLKHLTRRRRRRVFCTEQLQHFLKFVPQQLLVEFLRVGDCCQESMLQKISGRFGEFDSLWSKGG